MLLSKSSEYAIKLVFSLIYSNSDRFVRIKEIAPDVGTSPFHLTKIAQKLTQAGIIKSYTGPNGGLTLLKRPEDIFIMDVIAPFEGNDIFNECILGIAECGGDNPCEIHSHWYDIKGQIKQLFLEKSFRDLLSSDISELLNPGA